MCHIIVGYFEQSPEPTLYQSDCAPINAMVNRAFPKLIYPDEMAQQSPSRGPASRAQRAMDRPFNRY